jgi:hypothetical protein
MCLTEWETGRNLRAPVGGRAKGIPRNWRTFGEDELMKPLRLPLLVVTLRLSLGHGCDVEFITATRATSVKSVKLNID